MKYLITHSILQNSLCTEITLFVNNLYFSVLMIVDENLDVVDGSGNSLSVSGSQCVENIRKKLPLELEKRMFALVRSANDSTTDVAIYNQRAHGFLPKAPIRREKVYETLAPLWMKRFPPSEFVDSGVFDAMLDDSILHLLLQMRLPAPHMILHRSWLILIRCSRRKRTWRTCE